MLKGARSFRKGDASTQSAVTHSLPGLHLPKEDSLSMDSSTATSASYTPDLSGEHLDQQSRTARLSSSEPTTNQEKTTVRSSSPRIRTQLSNLTSVSQSQKMHRTRRRDSLPLLLRRRPYQMNTLLLPRAISSSKVLTHIDRYHQEYSASPCWGLMCWQ